jgi:hypothetical protein
LLAEEALAYQRLAAHSDFIDQVERGEPAMVKRLAAAQLNLVPTSDTPLLLASHEASPVTGWIDSTLRLDMRPARPEPVSTLSRWTSGPSRLWLFGGGIMAVFVGVMIAPGGSRRPRVGDVVGIDGWQEVAAPVTGAQAQGQTGASPGQGVAVTGRIDMWVGEPVEDGAAAVRDEESNGGVFADHVNRSEEDDVRVSEIADTVDLEPHEPWQWTTERTVIDDSRVDPESALAARDAAAGELILTAHELDGPEARDACDADAEAPTADASWDDAEDDAEMSAALLDSREGLGAGAHSDVSLQDVGTGLLDVVEHAHGGEDEAAAADAENEAVDTAATAPTAALETNGDEQACAREAAPESVVESKPWALGEQATEATASQQGGRRRPRRAKRRKSAEVAGEESPMEVEQRDEDDLADITAAPEPPAAVDDAHDDEDDDGDSPAISIPFLRNRSKAGRGRSKRSAGANTDTVHDPSLKSRRRPRRRG